MPNIQSLNQEKASAPHIRVQGKALGWGGSSPCCGVHWLVWSQRKKHFKMHILYYGRFQTSTKVEWYYDAFSEKSRLFPLHLLPQVTIVAQSLSHVRPWATPWTAAFQTPLSSTVSQSLLRLMSIESVTLSNHLILCCPFSSCPQSFPASGSFPVSWLFASSGQSIRASASASVLPMNIQDWFPLGLIGLISLKSKGLSRVFSNITVWKHQLFGVQPSLWSNSHIHICPLEKP